MEKVLQQLEKYRNNPIMFEDRKDFVNKLYTSHIDAIWHINRWQALRVWTHCPELFDREVLGEERWTEVHNLIDSAKESI